MPRITSAKNQRPACGRTTPTDRIRPVASAEASGDAAYPSLAAAARTLVRVSRETFGNPRRARDTVAAETPARRATSRIPAPRCSPGRPAAPKPFPLLATPPPYPDRPGPAAVPMPDPLAALPRARAAYPSGHARLRLRRPAPPGGGRDRFSAPEQGRRPYRRGRGEDLPRGRAGGAAAAHRDGDARHRALPAACPPRAAAPDPRRPRGFAQRSFRRAGPAEERQRLGRRRPAHVPGHGDGDSDGQARLAGALLPRIDAGR